MWDLDDEELLLQQVDEKEKIKWEYILKHFHSKHYLTNILFYLIVFFLYCLLQKLFFYLYKILA